MPGIVCSSRAKQLLGRFSMHTAAVMRRMRNSVARLGTPYQLFFGSDRRSLGCYLSCERWNRVAVRAMADTSSESGCARSAAEARSPTTTLTRRENRGGRHADSASVHGFRVMRDLCHYV